MAAPASVPRRTRTHGDAVARRPRSMSSPRSAPRSAVPAAQRPAARSARAVAAAAPRAHGRPTQVARPRLEIVAPRRRRALGLAVAGFTLLFSLMLGATALQARLAQNQLQLDALDRDLAAAKETYDVLRLARAELRSPDRLAVEAAAIGMSPGESTEFVSVPPEVIAQVAVAVSGVDAEIGGHSRTPLDEFAAVKAVAGGAP